MCCTNSNPFSEHVIQPIEKCPLEVRKNVKEKRLCCDCRIINENLQSFGNSEQLVSVKTHMCLSRASGSSSKPKGCCRCDLNESEASYLQLRCRQRSRSRTTKLYHTSSNWRPAVEESPNVAKPESSRWRPVLRAARVRSCLAVVVILVSLMFRVTESCSSKSTPRPRPSSPTNRPNVTFQTYTCPPKYATWYCLNGAKCFFVKIQDAILYNCECAEGYMGPRCQFKDLDGSYMPARERVILETASIAGGACIAIILTFLVLGVYYIYSETHRYKIKYIQSIEKDLSCIEKSICPQYVYTNNFHSSNLLTIENEMKKPSGISSFNMAVVKPNDKMEGLCVCNLPTINETVIRQESCPYLQ